MTTEDQISEAKIVAQHTVATIVAAHEANPRLGRLDREAMSKLLDREFMIALEVIKHRDSQSSASMSPAGVSWWPIIAVAGSIMILLFLAAINYLSH